MSKLVWVHEWLVNWLSWGNLIFALHDRVGLALKRGAVWDRFLLIWLIDLGSDITSILAMVGLNVSWDVPSINCATLLALKRGASWDGFGSLGLLSKLVWVDEWLVDWFDWGDLILSLDNRVSLALE